MEIRIHKKPELEKPRMIVGLPGMGMVAKNTVNFFLETLDTEFFADISMQYLSPSVAVFDNGLIAPLDREDSPFKFYYSEKENIILCSGEMQFGYITGDNELASKIVEVARLCGVEIIYTVLSTAIPAYSDNPQVFGVATIPELLEVLKQKDIQIAQGNMRIMGVNGLVIEYAWRSDIKGISLLTETAFPDVLDIKACYAGIKAAVHLLDIDADLGIIEKEVRKFEESLNNYIKQMQEQKKKEEDLSYIN